MRKISIVLLLVASAALGQVNEGDQHYAARAEGHVGGRAKAAQIDAAIAAYQRAANSNARDLEPRWKLLRAYRFKGAYVAATNDEKKKLYAEAKAAGEAALALLHVPPKATEKQVADAARTIPGAGEVFLWDAVNWGEWALAYGKMAAVREGAADRIKREATIALLVDPRMEGGAPARVLGRLHDQTPRIPFLTGWASEKEAVRFLTESLKLDPANKITKVFLAEAMVSNDGKTKPQAVQMLRECVSAPNPPEFEVENAAAAEDARALLKEWGIPSS